MLNQWNAYNSDIKLISSAYLIKTRVVLYYHSTDQNYFTEIHGKLNCICMHIWQEVESASWEIFNFRSWAEAKARTNQ